MSDQTKQHKSPRIILIIFVVIIALLGVIALVIWSQRPKDERLYNAALKNAFNGEFDLAMDMIDQMEDKTFGETQSIVTLCEAERALANEQYEEALQFYGKINFTNLNPSQQAALDKIKIVIETQSYDDGSVPHQGAIPLTEDITEKSKPDQ